MSAGATYSGTKDNYDIISRINHWVIAVAIIAMLCFGIYIFDFAPSGPGKGQLIGIHKAFGVLILIFALWRVAYRLLRGFKEDAAPMPSWQAFVARAVHWVLLASVILMPLSGMLGSIFGGRAIDVFGLFTVPATAEREGLSDFFYEVHETLAFVLIVTIGLHILGALKHHLFDKDTTLLRMLGRA